MFLALKNPYEMTNLIDNYDIACTFKNDLPRSEVMLINNKILNGNLKKFVDALAKR